MIQLLKIDILNTILIVISLLLAYNLPFELFLFAYAILGPLHYFTEINWVRDKDYFIKDKFWIYIIIGFSFLISLPSLLRLPIFNTVSSEGVLMYIKEQLANYTNSLFFMALIIAAVHLFVKNKTHKIILLVIGVLLALCFHFFNTYHLVLGIFLPTIIHVYVFTVLFMLYGTLKTNSKVGYLNIVLVLLVPIIITFISISKGDFFFNDMIKAIYVENRFHVLNVNISKLLGLSDGTRFFFYEAIDLKIQMFIAFAYIYHYLNWFSKTTVIGWHKRLNTKKSLWILGCWLVSVGLFYYDYQLGLSLVLFFSVLHVIIEFPLNLISIKSIGNLLSKKTIS
jgi:hypothetical protein